MNQTEFRDLIRTALDDERITVDALVTKSHADTLADELSEALVEALRKRHAHIHHQYFREQEGAWGWRRREIVGIQIIGEWKEGAR